MKVIMVMVMSLDGKTTRGHNSRIHEWTSKEDQAYFASLIKDSSLIIMGRKTYEAAKMSMQHTPSRLRVIVTATPEKYASEIIPHQLEFTNVSPKNLIATLSERGFTEAILAGGASLNTAFLKDNSVDELWITIEPILLGEGNALVATEKMNFELKMISIDRLNDKGTLLVKYAIKK